MRVPARPFVRPGIEEVMNNGRAQQIIEREVQAHLDREFK